MLVICLAAIAPIVYNPYLREDYRNNIAHYWSKIGPTDLAIVGDSLGYHAMGLGRLSTINRARSGLYVEQISLNKVQGYDPETILVFAGTNDINRPSPPWAAIDRRFRDMLSAPNTIPVLVACFDPAKRERIERMNGLIRKNASGPVIDLPITEGCRIKPEYTIDGVHLSRAAYEELGKALAAATARQSGDGAN